MSGRRGRGGRSVREPEARKIFAYALPAPKWLIAKSGVIFRPRGLFERLQSKPGFPPITEAETTRGKVSIIPLQTSPLVEALSAERRATLKERIAALIPKLQLETKAPQWELLCDLAAELGRSHALSFALELLPYGFLKFLKIKLNESVTMDYPGLAALRQTLTSDVLHGAMVRATYRARRAFAMTAIDRRGRVVSTPEHPVALLNETFIAPAPTDLPKDVTGVITVFDTHSNKPGERGVMYANKSFQVRDLDSVERTHAAVHVVNSYTVHAHPPYGSRSTVPTLDQFRDNLEVFTGGLLRGVDLSTQSVVLGGSSVLFSLVPSTPAVQKLWNSWSKYRRALLASLRLPKEIAHMLVDQYLGPVSAPYRAWRNAVIAMSSPSVEKPTVWGNSDIDLFFIAKTLQEAAQTIDRVYAQVTANMDMTKLTIYRTPNTLTIVGPYPQRHVQLVVGVFRSIEELLMFADMDCSAVVYDGKNVLGLPRTRRALNTRTNFIEPGSLAACYGRAAKYATRGFSAMTFETCKHTPRCDVHLGPRNHLAMTRITDCISRNGLGTTDGTAYSIDLHLPLVETEILRSRIREKNSSSFVNHLSQGGTRENFVRPISSGKTLSDVFPVLKPASARATSADFEDAILDPSTGLTEGDYERTLFLSPPSLRWNISHLLETERAHFFPKCYVCAKRFEEETTEERSGATSPPKKETDGPLALADSLLVCQNCKDRNAEAIAKRVSMSGLVAVVTGARIKIGYQTCLKLLRCGATVIAVTRFPQNAARRYLAEADSKRWASRVHIYGLDLRHTASVEKFLHHLVKYYPKIDILINNAAQTVRRPPAYYLGLVEKELDVDASLAGVLKIVDHDPKLALPSNLTGSLLTGESSSKLIAGPTSSSNSVLSLGTSSKLEKFLTVYSKGARSTAEAVPHVSRSAAMAMAVVTEGDEIMRDDALFPVGQTDPHGEQLDLRTEHSWTAKMEDIPAAELAEVTIVNSVVPFRFIQVLAPAMTRSVSAPHPSFVVNVTSHEGSFTGIKTSEHPHTNMQKAALNMLTRTIADDYAKKGIFVNSADTGWITSMLPVNNTRAVFLPPLSEIDGAARVLAPIFAVLEEIEAAASRKAAEADEEDEVEDGMDVEEVDEGTGEPRSIWAKSSSPANHIHGLLFKNLQPEPW